MKKKKEKTYFVQNTRITIAINLAFVLLLKRKKMKLLRRNKNISKLMWGFTFIVIILVYYSVYLNKNIRNNENVCNK